MSYSVRVLGLPSRERIHIPPKGKRKIIFKMPFLGDMLVPWRVYIDKKWMFSVVFEPATDFLLSTAVCPGSFWCMCDKNSRSV